MDSTGARVVAQHVRLLPAALASRWMWVLVPAIPFLIQLPANVREKAKEDDPQDSWKKLVALDWPSSSSCDHVGSEPMGAKALCLTLSPLLIIVIYFSYISFFKKGTEEQLYRSE